MFKIILLTICIVLSLQAVSFNSNAHNHIFIKITTEIKTNSNAPSDHEIANFMNDCIESSTAFVMKMVAFALRLLGGKIIPTLPSH